MATMWRMTVTLVDQDEKTTTLGYDVPLDGASAGDDFTTALAALGAWITDIKAISEANVLSSRLTILDQGGIDGTIPGIGDVSEEVVLSVHTNDTNFPSELANLRVPAPIDGVFVNDDPAQGGDLADTGLQNYVDNFASGGTGKLTFSDGEQVNTAEGVHGMADAYWRSVAKKIR